MVMTLGVVLAGGSSRRMGSDKALVEVAGRQMIEWVGSVLAAVCGRVIVVGRPSGWLGMEAIPDLEHERKGPLSGLVAAMTAYPGDRLMVVGVDQPWLLPRTVQELLLRAGDLPVVPVEGGARQTLCACYPAGLTEPAGAELENGGSIQSLLDRVSFDPVTDWTSWGEDGRSWFSVDTVERIEEGIERFGVPHPM